MALVVEDIEGRLVHYEHPADNSALSASVRAETDGGYGVWGRVAE